MNILGIDTDTSLVNICELDKNCNILNLKTLNAADVNQLYTILQNKVQTTSGLGFQEVLFKKIPLKIKNFFLLKKAIAFQEKTICSLNDAQRFSLNFYDKSQNAVNFFITTQKSICDHLNKMALLNIDPDSIYPSSLALCYFIKHFFEKISEGVIFHFASDRIYCVYMKNFLPEKSAVIKNGKKTFSVEFLEKIKPFLNSIETAEKHRLGVFLTGKISHELHFQDNFVNESFFPVKMQLDQEILSYAISIGLALITAKKTYSSINFRTKNFTSKKEFVKTGKKTFFFLLASLIATTSVFFLSNARFDFLKNKLFSSFSLLLQKENSLISSPNLTSKKTFHNDMDIFKQKLVKALKGSPHILAVPTASETLQALNSHSYLKNANITNFIYNLEMPPSNELNLASAVISLEFKTENKDEAENFYLSQTKGNDLANPIKTINWSTDGNLYKISFYLKNKAMVK